MVITLDHLQFWPSFWQYFTGQGRLWVSAAEGFFIISGLLIGYLRAYKEADKPLWPIAKKLLKRAGMLWLWAVVITMAVLVLSFALPGDAGLLPALPKDDMVASAGALLANIFTMNYTSDWIYFLRLYALMLTATPLFLWIIRKQHGALVAVAVSLGVYLLSLILELKEPALWWQVLFFGAALIGWKFESITAWLGARPKLRTGLLYSIVGLTVIGLAISYFMVHGWAYVESPTTRITQESYVSVRAYVDPVFSNTPLSFPRILLSFFWIFGLLGLTHIIRRPLKKYLGWLLVTFGSASLTAYCLQAVLLVFVIKFVELDGTFWPNTLAGAAVILLIWALMKIPLVQRVFPK